MALYVPASLRRLQPRWYPAGPQRAHVPFVYDLTAQLRPALVADLAAPSLSLFFAACQAVKECAIDSSCFAFGEFPDQDYFQEVSGHARESYAGFAYVLTVQPAEAAGHFTPGTVELLHVGSDADPVVIERWTPALAPGAVILVDGGTQAAGWTAITDATVGQFVLRSGEPLGVARMPGGSDVDGQLMRWMFAGGDPISLNDFYATAAGFVERSHEASTGAMPPKVIPRR